MRLRMRRRSCGLASGRWARKSVMRVSVVDGRPSAALPALSLAIAHILIPV
jgi:hypothetical protein